MAAVGGHQVATVVASAANWEAWALSGGSAAEQEACSAGAEVTAVAVRAVAARARR